jgi:hypothetical protein
LCGFPVNEDFVYCQICCLNRQNQNSKIQKYDDQYRDSITNFVFYKEENKIFITGVDTPEGLRCLIEDEFRIVEKNRWFIEELPIKEPADY